MTKTDASFDKDRARAFTTKMLGILNDGALSLMMSIGHKTGLFDSMDGDEPSTSTQIASKADLDERYVREWLYAMACGGIIDYDPESETFQLPAEHSGLLTRKAGPLNLTVPMQQIALLGEVEEDLVHVFREGGGLPYDKFPRFQALMSESSERRFRSGLVNQVVPLLEMSDALTAGIDVADVGCGSGLASYLLGKEFPNSRFVGFDMSKDGIAHASQLAQDLDNVSYEIADAAELNQPERFDLVTTFDAIHDQARPKDALAGIFAMLHPGGTYLCVEPKASSVLEENMQDPMAPFMYTISTMHCMTVSLAYGGDGLGTAWGHQLATEYLTETGFTDIKIEGIRDDRGNNYFISKKP
ncbi:MAG: class I SAM-dependent methyltransferase [Acidimicrobiales bacterium]|nr:class I SAM-dependent methyltransferase [Acidimicrobiales bacterium]